MSESLEIFKNVDVARYTTLKTGGRAELVFVPKSIEQLSQVLQQTPKNMPVTFLGLGSNALIPDTGIKGLVIILQGSGLNQIQLIDDQLNASVVVQAGVACGQFARFSARLGFTNMEFMAGIPGTIGGALAMNAGCYGWETWDLVSTVTTMDRDGQIHSRDKADFNIAYRSTALKNNIKPEYFISAEFDLNIGEKSTSLNNIKKLLAQRNQSQPTNYPNCGSVFRNPPNNYAAKLIEACGLKGTKVGGAQISEKHANFIVNLGGASTQDILNLINLMQNSVKQKFNIQLEQEVKYLGNVNSDYE